MIKHLRERVLEKYLSHTTSFQKIAQASLLCNIALVLVFVGILVSLIALVLGTYPVLIPALGNLFLALITLGIMYTGRLKLAAVLYFITLFILLFSNLIFNYGVMHIGSPFWVMLLNILVIYIVGIRWGILFLFASAGAFIYYVNNVLPTSLKIINNLPETIYYSAVYETVIALFILGYVIANILKTSRESDVLLTEQNRELRVHIDEKLVMLKEIHHRVKNNLQVIVSLMRLKMHEIEDPQMTMHYQETINRVMAMAKIHEKIYQSDEINKVDLKFYFHDLATDLVDTYQTDKIVTFNSDIRVDKMQLDLIVPMALIFNELFSNSLEHAFTNTENPQIDFCLSTLDGQLFFTYQDNGDWKANDQENSFGLELITTLAQQIDGELEFTKDPTRYQLKI